MNTTTIEQACDSANWRWRCWDLRSDGKVFWTYHKNYKNGERWVSWEYAIKTKKRNAERSLKTYYLKRGGADNNDKFKKSMERFRLTYSKKTKLTPKQYRLKNKNRTLEYVKKRRLLGLISKYEKEKRLNNPIFSMQHRVRCRIIDFIKKNGYSKPSKTQDMLGCDWAKLKAHLESKFVDGMSWANRSMWHIDHVLPLSSAKSLEEVVKLCHYTNLQPLWAEDNLRKSDRINA